MTTIFELPPKARPGASRLGPAPDRYPTTEPTELYSLAQAVQAAVQRVDEGKLEPVARFETGHTIRPKLLLALLTFCYARQTYASTEVAAWLRREVNLHLFPVEDYPDARTLCRFRRENREALHSCLMATLRFLAEQKVAAGMVTRVSEARLAEEASRRIIMAMFIDSMELAGESPSDAPVDLCYLFANGRGVPH